MKRVLVSLVLALTLGACSTWDYHATPSRGPKDNQWGTAIKEPAPCFTVDVTHESFLGNTNSIPIGLYCRVNEPKGHK